MNIRNMLKKGCVIRKLCGEIGLVILCAALISASPLGAEERKTVLAVSAPISCQVFQRNAKEQAVLTIWGTVNDQVDSIEAKAELVQGATQGKGTDWIRIAGKGAFAAQSFTGELRLQAGGWYKITVRATRGTQVVADASIDRVGVGEVFVTAGQSNSANFGTPKQKAKDDRVVYYIGNSYVPAADPIPGGCGGCGSPWMILGDLIAESQGVPVCFRSASLTWTEVKNWLPPDTQLYKNLVQCVKSFGTNGVRAVLWHQGESDSLAKTPATIYCDRLKMITEGLNRDCKYSLSWFVAQASFHPGSQATEQKEVARGQQMLWEKKIAFQGAITDDLLGGTYRSDGVHFNQAGLTTHAKRWFGALETHSDGKQQQPTSRIQATPPPRHATCRCHRCCSPLLLKLQPA